MDDRPKWYRDARSVMRGFWIACFVLDLAALLADAAQLVLRPHHHPLWNVAGVAFALVSAAGCLVAMWGDSRAKKTEETK